MKNYTKDLVRAALIAAIYAALTYISASMGTAYFGVQLRFSEALTILPVFTKAAIPGLTIGCFLGNLGSPYGIIDILCGTAATFVAAIGTRALRKIRFFSVPILSPLVPVVANAVIVGLEIAIFMPDGFSFAGFLISAASVGLGELIACYFIGLPLFWFVNKRSLKKRLFEN